MADLNPEFKKLLPLSTVVREEFIRELAECDNPNMVRHILQRIFVDIKVPLRRDTENLWSNRKITRKEPLPSTLIYRVMELMKDSVPRSAEEVCRDLQIKPPQFYSVLSKMKAFYGYKIVPVAGTPPKYRMVSQDRVMYDHGTDCSGELLHWYLQDVFNNMRVLPWVQMGKAEHREWNSAANSFIQSFMGGVSFRALLREENREYSAEGSGRGAPSCSDHERSDCGSSG